MSDIDILLQREPRKHTIATAEPAVQWVLQTMASQQSMKSYTCRDSDYREYRSKVRRVSTVSTSLDWKECIFCTVSPHSFTLAMSSKKRYISWGQYNRERVWMCTGVNVNARTNLFPPQNGINDRRMDVGCNKGTILRYPSSEDTYIWCYFRTYAFYHMLCYTTNTVFPSCLNIDSFRRPHQRQNTPSQLIHSPQLV